MLKKRILASTMASVMALSSVSVVAFADDTVDYGTKDAVSQTQLKEYVKALKEEYKGEKLEVYGEIQSDRFNNAIDHATGVYEDSNATSDEVVAAFQMLKAVKNSLRIYTTKELQNLIADNKSKYDTDNVLNEDIDGAGNSDDRWTEETWDAFEEAYSEADRYSDETDSRVICDMYCALEDAANGLKDAKYVTKAEFRAVYNEYENIISKLKDYQPWRRGVCTVNSTDGGAKSKAVTSNNYDVTAERYVTFEELEELVHGASTTTRLDINTGDTFLKVKSGASGTVFGLVSDAYDQLTEHAKATNRSSNEDILDAYKTAQEAIKVFNGWKVDDNSYANLRDINKLLENNRSKLIKGEKVSNVQTSYLNTFIADIIDSGKALEDKLDVSKLGDGKLPILDTVTGNVPLTIDKRTGWLAEASGVYDDTDYSSDKNYYTKNFKAGDDIAKYIPITNKTIDSTTSFTGKKTELDAIVAALVKVDAYKAAERETDKDDRNDALDAAFKAHVKSDATTNPLDVNKTISKGTGSSDEYTLLFTNLQYTFDDFNSSYKDKYTKSDIEALMKDVDELVENTEEASAFAENNIALVNARKAVKQWLAAANKDKTYKANSKLKFDLTYAAGTWTAAANTEKYATEAYSLLKDAYDKLKKQYDKYPVSYGEVADLIAQVGIDLDAGVYDNAKIRSLAATIAYELSVLDATDNDTTKEADNEPFTESRDLIIYNRVYKDGNDAEKTLLANYKMLKEEVEKATAGPAKGAGDVDGDGVLTLLDAQMVLKGFLEIITLTADQTAAGDMDGDGDADLTDAQAILVAFLNS